MDPFTASMFKNVCAGIVQRDISRRIAIRESYVREIQPFIKKKAELRAFSPMVCTITHKLQLVTSGPQLSAEMQLQDRMLDEIIEAIGREYERAMMRCCIDMPIPGGGTTAAYRMDFQDETPLLTAISAREMYRPPTSPMESGRNRMPSCASCHAEKLETYFTSQRDGRILCQGCFDAQADKGLAKEQGKPMRNKTLHPLDAWME